MSDNNTNNSLVSFGDLSKPATVLIEKISSAVGILYEPTRIRKKAQAEADAEKTKAIAQLEISDLQRRALERLVHEEARKQENIEQITAEAVSHLKADADPTEMSEDWIANFFAHCNTVSDTEMRTLWANVLAGEASKPGSFSKRTVNIVANLDKREADLFTALGQFVWNIGQPAPIILDVEAPAVVASGLTSMALHDLESLGLISFQPLSGYSVAFPARLARVEYHGTFVDFQFTSEASQIDIGRVAFTKPGRELYRICGAKPSPQYLSEVLEIWRKRGINVSIPAYRSVEVFNIPRK